MLISRSKKFIFVHIKKTAGSSITSQLKAHDDRNLILKALNTKIANKSILLRKLNPFPFHAPAYSIREHLGSAWNDYFSFAFVRNPFDWQVSNYFYIKQSRFHPRHREVRGLSFNEYLDWTQYNGRIYLQSASISEKDDHSRIIVDFVGKFENIDNDFSYILSRIGINDQPKLNKSNQSSRQRDYKKYYDTYGIDFMHHHYAQDLQNFDYSF